MQEKLVINDLLAPNGTTGVPGTAPEIRDFQ